MIKYQIDNSALILTSTFVIIVSSRLHLSRYTNKVLLPLILAIITYRYFNFNKGVTESFISILIDSINEPALKHLVGDVLGVGILFTVADMIGGIVFVDPRIHLKNIIEKIFSLIKKVVSLLNY